jgi:hypothetical protein
MLGARAGGALEKQKIISRDHRPGSGSRAPSHFGPAPKKIRQPVDRHSRANTPLSGSSRSRLWPLLSSLTKCAPQNPDRPNPAGLGATFSRRAAGDARPKRHAHRAHSSSRRARCNCCIRREGRSRNARNHSAALKPLAHASRTQITAVTSVTPAPARSIRSHRPLSQESGALDELRLGPRH